MRGAGATLRAITGQMEEINHVMQVVECGASEQNAALGSIDATTRQVKQVTHSNSAAAEEVTRASRTVIDAVSEVVRQMEKFRIDTARDAVQARAA